MVRRRLPFWIFYFDNSQAAACADTGDLDLDQVERCPAGGKASSESATARRRAATMSDGLICSSNKPHASRCAS